MFDDGLKNERRWKMSERRIRGRVVWVEKNSVKEIYVDYISKVKL